MYKHKEGLSSFVLKSYDNGIIVYGEKLMHFLDQKVFFSR
jgi:hypothetical protein